MFIKLDENVARLLCCPICKSDLEFFIDRYVCKSCGLIFHSVKVKTGDKDYETVFDFRIHRPHYCVPKGFQDWKDTQYKSEVHHDRLVEKDSLQSYLDEIDSVYEIYTEEFHIDNKVLDVGGHQGRLRHYLGKDVISYVSVDPFIHIFENIVKQQNLLKAYPCLSEPCNFIAAHAEYLPFRSDSFDWIHMRSVVDHFADPYQAFIEAHRCCKPGGKLLVGLSIIEKIEKKSFFNRVTDKLKREGLFNLAKTGFALFARALSFSKSASHIDSHMFCLTYTQLRDLFEKTGWNIVKEHWQKPPCYYCLYICGQVRK